MRIIIYVSCTLALLLVSPTYSQQQRQLTLEGPRSEGRVALIIGNSAYAIGPLKNPVNDARDMALALRELGFEVIHKENLNQNDMKRAIQAFGERIRGGGIGLFYYAGHGVQVKGINYLVPVDTTVESEEEVEYNCVDVGLVLARMESARNKMNIMILDACRNNPFTRSFRSVSRGLAHMDAPSGTLIAYATAPGSIASDGNGRNGVYTEELLKNIRTPGLGIEEVFKRVRISVRNLTQEKQTPWESSSLTGDFYFVYALARKNKMLPVTTFSDKHPPVTDWGTFHPSGRNLAMQVVVGDPDQSRGEVMRITYNVPKADDYAGFWLKFRLPDFQPAEWPVISFWLRGDSEASYTRLLKVELKIREAKWGWKTLYIGNISNEWQQIRLRLEKFRPFQVWEKDREDNEFVLTFENSQVTTWKGVIYLDDIAFEKE